MKSRVLILFAHPRFENSQIHKALIQRVRHSRSVHIHDLYEIYPAFNIDVYLEQRLLNKYDIILWQHPVYWYSIPPLLKQWIDLVLSNGWAYGKNTHALEGKYLLQVFSGGHTEQSYSQDGYDKHSLRQYMACHEQTAKHCHLNYLPPYVIHDAHKLSAVDTLSFAHQYERLLNQLIETDLSKEDFSKYVYINDWIKS